MAHDATVLRLTGYLHAMARAYPQAWSFYDRLSQELPADSPAWPAWCYAPLAAAYAVVSEGHPLSELDRVPDVGRLGALAAWRPTQGIYRFDPAVLDALWAQPLDDAIPPAALQRLPEWCVYIETPATAEVARPFLGFFAHLESDANTGGAELRLVLDDGRRLHPFPLLLGYKSLEDAVLALDPRPAGQPLLASAVARTVADRITPLVQLVLYLCARNAEIRRGDGLPGTPRIPDPTPTRHGPRWFPPDRPRIWEAGYHIGPALRASYPAAPAAPVAPVTPTADASPGSGSHASPRPHIRRAHWHAFWTGPRQGPRQLTVQWLPPIPVGVGPDAPVTPTLRRVPSPPSGTAPKTR